MGAARPRRPPPLSRQLSSPSSLRPPSLRSSPFATSARSRVSESSTCSASRNISGFFADVERDLTHERRELSEEEEALKATLRARHRAGCPETDQYRCFQGTRSFPSSSGSKPGRCMRPQSAGANAGRRSVARQHLPTFAGLQEWEQHDKAWARFQADPPCPLSAELVPWPPCNDDVLEFCERLQAPGQRKLAYSLACRRWHPDKFLQLYGSLVQASEMAEITARLNDVFQSVSSQWRRGCARV